LKFATLLKKRLTLMDEEDDKVEKVERFIKYLAVKIILIQTRPDVPLPGPHNRIGSEITIIQERLNHLLKLNAGECFGSEKLICLE
jgi:hypothetical protein